MNTPPIQPPILPTPPQPPVPPFVPPPPPQVKKSPKLLYLLLILIFLAASSIFAYKYYQLKQQLAQLSPTPSATTIPTTDLTADWETYTNPQYKYSIKYPSDMVLEQNTEDPFYPSYVIFTNEANQFNIRARENTVLAETEEIRSQTEGHVLAELIKNETMQVDNVTARLLEYTTEDQNNNRSTLIIPSGKNVIIINAQSDIFDLILSTFKFIDKIEPEPSPSTPIVKIPIISTSNWISVANNGVQFKIPPQAKCNDDQTCTQVSWTSQYQGQTSEHNIRIEVEDYQGGSRREQFYHQESDCHDIYQEASFGSVKALQIAIDIGWCNGGGGAILAVVNNKLVIVHNLSYNFETKEIARWDIRDTLISTLN